MIPVDADGEKKLLKIEEILLDLLDEFGTKKPTKTNLLSLQMNLNEIAKRYLPLIVEVDGTLWVVIGYSTKFLDDGRMAFSAKLQEDSEIILDLFSRKSGKGNETNEIKGFDAN